MFAYLYISHYNCVNANPRFIPDRYLAIVSGYSLVHYRNSKLLILMMGIGNKYIGSDQDKLAYDDSVGC